MMFDEDLDTVLLREKRFRMVEEQIRLRSIHDKRILEMMKRVPRHLFFEELYMDIAYGDHPINIGCGQSCNQPFMTGLMLQALELRPMHKVLEIGTGSGYQAAIIGEIVSHICTIEKEDDLLSCTKKKLKEFGYQNIEFTKPKKAIGWPLKAPFDRIIVSGALSCIPEELISQLSPKGILVTAVGAPNEHQIIYKIINDNGKLTKWKVAIVSNLSMITDHKLTPTCFD